MSDPADLGVPEKLELLDDALDPSGDWRRRIMRGQLRATHSGRDVKLILAQIAPTYADDPSKLPSAYDVWCWIGRWQERYLQTLRDARARRA